MTIILSLLAGTCCGLSAGIGFNPVFRQPKNIIVQCALAVVGVISIIILFGNINDLN